MTHRERMLATLRGEPVDAIPWAPRLDLWYNAHRRAGTLPKKSRNASRVEITDELGWGYHAGIPDFKDLRDPDDDAHRALGIYNLWTMPLHTRLENVDFSVERRGDETTVEYRTPVGSVRTVVRYDDGMREAGITISHVSEHAIKGPADYEPVGFIFENARVEPNDEGYQEFAEKVGGRGLAVGFLNSAASPLHLLLRELMPLELFFYETSDHPEELARCAGRIGSWFERVLELAPRRPAEVLLLGANYDAGVTYPPFFAEQILPWLKRFAEALHREGKFLLSHTDGENTGLLEHYLAAKIDIADSICPAPMTKLTLKEVRDHFAGRISIMGGIPSVALLRESMPDAEFEGFLDTFFAELGAGDHLILGISDTTPPGADFERLLQIAARVREFGPVGPVGRAQGGA